MFYAIIKITWEWRKKITRNGFVHVMKTVAKDVSKKENISFFVCF